MITSKNELLSIIQRNVSTFKKCTIDDDGYISCYERLDFYGDDAQISTIRE